MKMLLVYGTTEGQTRNIARFVADRLIQKGNQVSTVDVAEQALPPDPCAFDAVLVAASIHAGRYQSAVIDFVRENLAALRARPSAFLSVSLAAASKDGESLRRRCTELNHDTEISCFSVEPLSRRILGALAAVRWRQDYHLFIPGALAFTAAYLGRRARRKRQRNWAKLHITGMGLSYVLLLTAFYVDNGKNLPLWRDLPPITFWLLPAAIGVPLIVRALWRHPLARAPSPPRLP